MQAPSDVPGSPEGVLQEPSAERAPMNETVEPGLQAVTWMSLRFDGFIQELRRPEKAVSTGVPHTPSEKVASQTCA